MKNIFQIQLFILTFIFVYTIAFSAEGQEITKVQKTPYNYTSYLISSDTLFGINDSGSLVVWNLKIMDTIFTSFGLNKIRISAIAKDKNNEIYLGSTKGDIFKLDQHKLIFELIKHSKYFPIKSIFFNSKNEMFLIIPNAVYYPSKDKYWDEFLHGSYGVIIRKRVLGLYWKTMRKYFNMPQYSYIDLDDRIWMTSSFGEFGGDIQIFDTRTKKICNGLFKNIDPGLFSPKSVFNDSAGNIFITSGLQHMRNTGEIFKIQKDSEVTKIYYSQDYIDTAKKTTIDRVFVGPGAYNKLNNCIYFASSNGFYKAKNPERGKLIDPELLFNPLLHWGNEPLACGASMAVKKMEFTYDGKMIFLTAFDGFGIYFNGKLIMFK